MAHLKDINNELIRYANVWEDAAVLRKGLQIQPGERILSIGSAGDNCFALLLDDPSLVVAADINIVQLHLIELKMAAIRSCTYDEVLFFLGFRENVGLSRLEIYKKIKSGLSPEAVDYWDRNFEIIDSGVVHEGKFEKYFQLFSGKILPLIHSKRTTADLLSTKSAEAQRDFFHKKWNTWRWKFFFKIFFSRKVMGLLGRDPAFLKQVKINVGDFILSQAEDQLTSVQAQDNFILRYNLTGNFGDLLPAYLKDETVFASIKNRLDRIKLLHGLIETARELYGNFDAMNLSDIFEYMNDEIFLKTSGIIQSLCNEGARIGYWNLMVDRRMSEILPTHFRYQEILSQELTAQDRGFFYNRFIIDKAI